MERERGERRNHRRGGNTGLERVHEVGEEGGDEDTLLITAGVEGTAREGAAAAAGGVASLGDVGVAGGLGVPPLGGLMGGVEGAEGAGRASAVASTSAESARAKALRAAAIGSVSRKVEAKKCQFTVRACFRARPRLHCCFETEKKLGRGGVNI